MIRIMLSLRSVKYIFASENYNFQNLIQVKLGGLK